MSTIVREIELGKGRIKIFLDSYEHGIRKREKLFIAKKSDKEALAEYRRMAKIVASKRELELQAKENGVVPLTKQRKDLLTFFQEVMETKSGSTRDSYQSTLLQLKAFAAKKGVSGFLFSDVNVMWFEESKRLLSEKLAKKTIEVYGSLVKHVLRLAARNGPLQLALLEQFKVEKAPQHKRDYLPCRNLKPCRAPQSILWLGTALSPKSTRKKSGYSFSE